MLGPFQVTLAGEPVTRFETEKARALLAYLAADASRPHRREVLAEMLWPGRREGAARANLRHTLATLRRTIGDHEAEPPFLLPTRHTIQFNASSNAWSDVSAFSARLPACQPTEPPTRQTIHELEEAAQLYRGPFLEDVSLADSASFQEWLVLTREQFGRQVLDALSALAEYYERNREYEQALTHAWRQVELEPWGEGAQQRVMRLLALSGDRCAALAQYETCCRLLAEELGVEPAEETTRLYQQISGGKI